MLRRFCAFAALLASLLLAPAAAQAAVTHAASTSASGNGSAAGSLTVPAGGNRYLVVGVSTLESAVVQSVTYGAQVLTREHASAKDSSRAEVWVLKAPNAGTANVTATVTGGAPVVVGASAFTGVDQTLPLIASTSINAANGSNSASLVLNQNVEADGMFGVIAVNDADNITGIRTTGSVDTVVADLRWTGRQGSVLSAGATRRGWTGLNFSINAGIGFYWNRIDPSHLMPYSYVLTGLRQATTPEPQPNRAPTADAGGPYAIDEGSTLTLHGSGTDADDDALTYAWDVDGDGDFDDAVGATPTLTVAKLRTFGLDDGPATASVRVRVSDGAAATTSAAAAVTVRNVAPTANVVGGRALDEGERGQVRVVEQSDPVDTTFTYDYDFGDDGTWDVTGSSSPTVDVPAALTADGPVDLLVVRARIRDEDGGSNDYVTGFGVRNVAPTAKVADVSVDEGSAATLRVTDVVDVPADLPGVRYAYDLDDDGTFEITGSASSEVALPDATTADGPDAHTVRVRVSDKDGGSNTYTARITVRGVAPTAALPDVGPIDEGTVAQVRFTDVADASPVDTAAGVRFRYDFDDDGAWDVGGAGYFGAVTSATATVPAALTADGDKDLTVRAGVIDKNGAASEYELTIKVRNAAPTAKLTGATVDEGRPATVMFSDADDVAADEAAGFGYEFDLDDDGTFEVKGTDPTATVKRTDGPATLPVKAAIVDKDGGRREYTAEVVVRNVAPTLTVTGADTATTGQAVALTLAGADAGGDALSGTVDWGDGTSDAYAATAAHTYAAAGAYTVTVTLRDKDGAQTTATHAITVAAPLAPPAAPAPTPAPAAGGGVLGAEATSLELSAVRVTPRCIRAAGLRAVATAAKTIKVQFRTSADADVMFRLTRQDGKRGASKCPPATGVAQRGGRKVPGVYSPFSRRAVQAKRGLNTVTLAATTGTGKALAPGTYLLTITAGDVTARTKVWVLAQ